MKEQHSPNWGGTRPKSGRKPGPRKQLNISKGAAKSLHLLTKLERAARGKPDLTEEIVLEELVEAKWQEINAEYEENAEIASEFIL